MNRKIAFCFAGQGSQYTGMGKELYENSNGAKNIFDMAEKLRPNTMETCFNADISELSLTENTQPCLFCVDLAAAETLKENGIMPEFLAGFSLGEIPALAFSGILSYEDAFKLVVKRGEYMGKAANENPGSMAAVLKLSNEDVEETCSHFNKMYPVNYNCKGQLVVAGDKDEMPDFVKAISEKKGRAKVLNVSGAFHSPFMKDAADLLSKELENINTNEMQIPLYSNYTAEVYGENVKELVVNQVCNAVKWQQIVENLTAQGVDTFIEVGAGKTLSGLIKKIAPEALVLNVMDNQSLQNTLEMLKD